MSANERTVRRSQTITPFGVGAIVDMLGESFVAEDISRWRGRKMVLREPRIAAHFGVQELRTAPPVEDHASGLPYFRFPQWLFCGSCRRMTQWSVRDEKPGAPAKCGRCRQRPQLVPMRFVVVCGRGHLDDVNWWRWAHSDPRQRDQRQCGRRDALAFENVKGVGGGLESVRVRCDCGASRSLRDLPAPDALKRLRISCRGRQPWQFENEAESCDSTPVVLQRGASSVYYASIGSALDIPPDSDWAVWGGAASRIRNNPQFGLLEAKPDHPLRQNLIDLIAQDEKVTAAEVGIVLDERVGVLPPQSGDASTGDTIEAGEWHAFTHPRTKHDPRDNFIATVTPFPSPAGHGALQAVADELANRIGSITLANRLREIRVLQGFQRHTMDRTVPPDLGRRENFLPAVEVFGEGVFLRFDEDALADWERGTEVLKRCATLRTRLSGSMHARWLEAPVTPRLVLIHTFAHVLMRAVAFEAGYSASSLRERIYTSVDPADGRAGVLVYTAAGDAEGTMGGLARLGEAERLVPIIASALAASDWCSLDPVCRESHAQGVDGLSMAACHACALASETSCVLGNVMLDRMLLVDPGFGFFADTIGALRDMQSEKLT
jgi:hypothetical protein